jgi:hypothetical protein
MKKMATATFLAVITLIISLTALILSLSMFAGIIPINSQVKNQTVTPTISPTSSPTNPSVTPTQTPTVIPTIKPSQSPMAEPTNQSPPIPTNLAILDIIFSDRNIMTILTAQISGNLTDQNGRGVTNATVILNAYSNDTQGWIKIGEGQTHDPGYFSIYVSTYVNQYSQIQAVYNGDSNYKPCSTSVEYSSIPASYVVI